MVLLAVVFAAMSALSYGASDFSGALASKDNDSTMVTLAMQLVSLASLVVIIVVFTAPVGGPADYAWGALGGIGAALGLTTFYRALAIGPMSTAASLTALTSAALPVIVGLIIGERPGSLTLIGIALAVPAAVLVSLGGLAVQTMPSNTTPRDRVIGRRRVDHTRFLAIAAGFGFGLFFIALSRTSGDAGLLPLVAARFGSIAALGLVLTQGRAWAGIDRRWWPSVIIAGLLDCAANSFYLTALRFGSFTWVAAISSLYPVSTVLLARLVLDERIVRVQKIGLVLAGGALTLVAVGA